MKRDLYAHNEKDENKCTSQVRGRCWATLVNNQRPCGGKTQSPKRLPLWPVPTGPSSVFGLGVVETGILRHVRGLGTQANVQTLMVPTSKQRKESSLVRMGV